MTEKASTIVCDPPWPYHDQLESGTVNVRLRRPGRGAHNFYELMTISDIAAIPVGDWAADNAHLYLWTTNAFLVEAHELMRGWGFNQKTLLTWVKDGIGMGHYYRNNTEHVLFGVRGKLATLRADQPTAFRGKGGDHSQKPDAFYDMVETMSPGPYLDVFARGQRMGWDVWGNEVYSAEGLPSPALQEREAR